MTPSATRGSLRQGLARAMVLTTGGSLAASLLALVGLQVFLAPRDFEQRLGGMGDVIALYSMPAVEFDDPEAGHPVRRHLEDRCLDPAAENRVPEDIRGERRDEHAGGVEREHDRALGP